MFDAMRVASMALAWTLGTLLPTASAAQTAPWQTAPPASSTPTLLPPAPPPVVLAPVTPPGPAEPEAAPAVRFDPNPGTRYALEGLAGLGMGVGGGLVTMLGVGLLASSPSLTLDDVFLVAMVGGGAILLGIPLGVTLVGNSRGGNGGYGWSLLGMLAGSLVGDLLLVPLMGACRGPDSSACGVASVLGSALALGSVLTGAVLGYELSNDQRHLSRPGTPPRARWTPMAIPMRGGLTLGVAAVF